MAQDMGSEHDASYSHSMTTQPGADANANGESTLGVDLVAGREDGKLSTTPASLRVQTQQTTSETNSGSHDTYNTLKSEIEQLRERLK